MTADNFQPGDVVRVLTHAPHNTRLLAGDEVTVERVKVDTEDNTVLLVRTDLGLRALYTYDVEHVSRVYRPAAPNAEIDAAFANLLDSDPELAAIFNADADTALGAVDDEVSAVLTAEQGDESGTTLTIETQASTVTFTTPGDGDGSNFFNVTDAWGDHVCLAYQEGTATDGTKVGRLMIVTDEPRGVSLRCEYLPVLIEWLQSKHDRLTNPGDE